MKKLFCSDCLEVLASMPDACVDAVVTDPPYGLSFMGKGWDYQVPSVEIWEQCLRVLKPGGHLLAFAGTRTQHRMCVNIEDAGFEIRDMIAWVYGSGFPKSHNLKDEWYGWGTALKPALEPITVARKPFKGTVANNVLKHGTGAINIDGCRVNGDAGRWPANLIHDGSNEVTQPLNNAARFFYCAKASKKDREEGCEGLPDKNPTFGASKGDGLGRGISNTRQDLPRKNTHPTVKPTDLMAYLCRLVTPPGGIVLDPFMGSGSTGKAAMQEGFNFVGIEREQNYFDIAEKRLACSQMSLM